MFHFRRARYQQYVLSLTLHQQAVDRLGMVARQGAQGGRQGNGEPEGGAGQQVAALLGQPPIGLLPVTLGTVAVAAGVVGIARLCAVVALVHVPPQGRRPAGLNIPQGPALTGRQGRAVAGAVRRPVEADDVGHLQHDDRGPGLRGPS